MTCLERLSTRKEIRGGGRINCQSTPLGHSRKKTCQTRRDPEALGGKLNGRLKQIGPGKLAVLVMGTFVHGNGTRNTNGLAALPGLKKVHDLAVFHKHINGSAGWCYLPSLMERELSAFPLENKHKAASAQTRALRLNQPQHRVCRDGRIDRMTTLFQHFYSCRNRVRICCRGHGSFVPAIVGYRTAGNGRSVGSLHSRSTTQNKEKSQKQYGGVVHKRFSSRK